MLVIWYLDNACEVIVWYQMDVVNDIIGLYGVTINDHFTSDDRIINCSFHSPMLVKLKTILTRSTYAMSLLSEE